MDKKNIFAAVIMAAGSGMRMRTATKKQFMELGGMPVAAHSIKAFELNDNIDDIVLVVPKGCVEESVSMCMKYGFRKIRTVTEGGSERFRSVYNGLNAVPENTDYVLIHDGVRPLVTAAVIDRCCKYVPLTNACVAAVPVTDTIKRADVRGFARETVDRSQLWSIQTPQAFSYSLLKKAYDELFRVIDTYGANTARITDDAVVIENMTDTKVRIIRGDYMNIKITTPSDLIIAEAFLREREKLSGGAAE